MLWPLTNLQLVLAADPLYDDDHPILLCSAIVEQLAMDGDAKAIVMVPLRDKTTLGLLATFRFLMSQGPHSLVCVEEGQLSGQDDWDDGEDSSQVQCWWGIFSRQNKA